MTERIKETMRASADEPARQRLIILPTLVEMLAADTDEGVLAACKKIFVRAGYKLPPELSPAARMVIEEGRRRRLVPPELDASFQFAVKQAA